MTVPARGGADKMHVLKTITAIRLRLFGKKTGKIHNRTDFLQQTWSYFLVQSRCAGFPAASPLVSLIFAKQNFR
jgi:hypothetical protein